MTTWIGQRLIDLSACLASELTKPTCWHGVWSGEVPYAACGECDLDRCGMSYVRLTAAFPSTSFPVLDEGGEGGRCTSPLAYEVEIGVLRCLPAPDADGSMPPPDDFSASNLLVQEDMEAMLRAVQCCLSDGTVEHQLGQYQPLGPDGMCVGGAWPVTLARG